MKYFLAAAIAILMTAAATAQSASLSEIRSLAQQSRYQEAYDRLETYLQRRPGDEQGRLLKGVLLTRLDRIDDAIDAFRGLADDKPQLPEPHNNLAVLYAAQGRYDDARRSLEQAVALQPGYGTARENLGDIYARLAHIEYMRAYEIDGDNTRALDKANTVVNLFERIARGGAKPEPAPEPAPITASVTPEPPTPAPPPRASAGDAMVCFEVAGLRDQADVTAVANWFEQRGVKIRSGVREELEMLNFQVYAPPLSSRAEAKALFGEMQAAGIRDIALIPRGDLRNGISLGVYSSEANAKRRLTMLREMGYETQYRQRSRTRKMPFVEATALDGIVSPEAFSRAFPGVPITPTACS